MKYNDLKTLVASEKLPDVRFKPEIEQGEDYAEPGMRARVIGLQEPDENNVVEVTFDFGPFESHNVALEVRAYYDKHGLPTLTARESGHYKAVDRYWFMVDDDMPFELIGDLRAWEAYRSEPREVSYVEWLEAHYCASVAKP